MISSPPLISYENALKKILAHAEPLPVIARPLAQLLGYILAEPVIAPFDLPLFDNSAMDGFGVKAADVANASDSHPAELAVQDTIQAGDGRNIVLTSGHAVKILTGAPIPHGVDAVVMKERCDDHGSIVHVKCPAKTGENIRTRGEEFRTGNEILPADSKITPPVIGMLATLGYAEFSVYRKPAVGIITTGNELIQPGEPLTPGKIYDSNSYALQAALQELGMQSQVFRVKDNAEETQKSVQQALANFDVVVTLGGVSVGDFDFVKDVVESCGVETLFWRIAIKPGKPVYFGRFVTENAQKLVFGLPGNPVSALVTFHQLVQPALLKMSGLQENNTGFHLTAKLSSTLKKKPGRMELVRGILSSDENGFHVTPTQGQDSHMLGGLSKANCLIHFEDALAELKPGDIVSTDLLRWN